MATSKKRNQKVVVPALNKALLLLRVSTKRQMQTDDDPEGISVPTQREACKRKARELGLRIIDEYIEPGNTGTAIARRPVFRRMMQRIRTERDVDHIIMYETSRLNRNWKENGATLLELAGFGVKIVSATEDIDESTADGELMMGIKAVLNGYRSRKDGEDIQRKMTYKASQGGTVFRAPIGYLNVKKRIDGRIVSAVEIDPERAPLVRLAFELYATGRYSYRALQEALTEAGLRTRANGLYGERAISIYRLGTMLQDRYYLGYVEWGDAEYDGKHEPLIDQELFDRVQRVLMAERGGGARERTHNHYLKGVVWCDRCQKRLIIMRGKNRKGELYFYYLCRGRQDKTGCDLPYLSVAKVVAAVEAHYATVHLPEDFISRVTTLMDEAATAKQATASQMREAIEKELRELDTREDRYLDLYGEGEMPKAKLNERLKDIHDNRARLTAQLDTLTGELETGRQVLTSAMELLNNPRKLYEEAKTPARKVLNKAIFTKLFIDDLGDHVAVTNDELKEPFATVIYARRAEAGMSATEARQAAQEAIREAEAELEADNTLAWLEAEMGDAWARLEGTPGQQQSGLVTETAPDLDLAALLNSSLVGACSSRGVMVPPAGFEPALPPPEGGALSPELRGPVT